MIIRAYFILILVLVVFISISQVICLILYMSLIVYLFFKQIQLFKQYRRHYFSQFWSYVDLGLIICSWMSVPMFIWQYNENQSISRRFSATNGYMYINLQRAVYIDDVNRFFLAFSCFFACLKCLRLCRFHRRLSFLARTIRYISPELISFTGMFSIVFVAFLCLFYLLFGSQLQTCSTLLTTGQMLLEMSLMKFDVSEFTRSQPQLGPICFSLFILIVVFVCMSMFVTIISKGFRYVRDHDEGQPDVEQDIARFMLDRCKQWLGKSMTRAYSNEPSRSCSMSSRRLSSNGQTIIQYQQ
jgi:polycystin 2L1